MGADSYVAAAANMDLALDPLTGNRYLYAGANPANLIDDGHAPKKKCKGWRCWGRRALKGAVIVGGVAGAVACGASVVCGVAVGVAAGAASYTASNAGTNNFRWSELATEAAVGGTLGGLGAKWSLISSWRNGRELSVGGARFSLGNVRAMTKNGEAYMAARLPHSHIKTAAWGKVRHRPWETTFRRWF